MSNPYETTHAGIMAKLGKWWEGVGRKRGRLMIAPASEEMSLNAAELSAGQVNRLMSAAIESYEKMAHLRRTSKAMRQQYMSHLLTDEIREKDGAVVINKIMDAVRIWMQNLATGEPRLGVESLFPNLRPFATTFELAVNRHLSEIELGATIHLGVLDALFSVGLFKTALGAGAAEVFKVDGEIIDPGQAFTDRVFIDDMVCDMGAKSKEQMRFIGDRYLRPRSWVNDMMKARKNGDKVATIANRNDSRMMPESSITGFDESNEDANLYDDVWVWDFYLPHENMIVTIPDGAEEPLAVWEWDGPEGGPYDMLGWLWCPGHPLPIPPIANIYEMHNAANAMARKVIRQTNRQKDVLGAEAGAEKAVEILKRTGDGEIAILPQGSMQKIQNLKFGGADPAVSQMLIWSLGLIDTEAGNLQSLGGLGPSTETAKGDQLIADSASGLIKFLQVGLNKTAKKILKKHAWWVWTDDVRTHQGSMEIEGTGINVPWAFTPEEREGDFLDFNFHLEPFSLVDRTPSEKAQAIMSFWNGFIMPNAEMMMQSGMVPNFADTAKYLCKQMDIPFDILFQMADPKMLEKLNQGMTDAPPRLKQSHTVNERISRPGTTPRGQDNMMIQSLGQAAGVQSASA